MTTALTSKYLTLQDWSDRQKPEGGVADIIEILTNSNPIIKDAHVMEGNLPTGHRSIQRTSRPSGSWRQLNAGVDEEKSTTEPVTDSHGMLEGLSRLDVDTAKLHGDQAAFRASEDNAFVEGFNDTIASAIFYSDHQVNPEQMHGFAPRYNALTSPKGATSTQMISAGGSGSDNMSIWLITWGPKKVSLMFPKGSQAGLTSEDLGKQLVLDDNSKSYLAWVTRFQWKIGLVIEDYRYAIRICNIDNSELTSDAATGADLMDFMTDAYYARPTVDLDGVLARTFFYVNKTAAKFLHKQASNKGNVNLSLEMPGGKPLLSYLDVPIHVNDSLTIAEATIS
jgi:hypothetical protein|tara:strand:- start:611 stop:1624 length:1014 start_codon:yes stop_codon:yes gene_type:complete